MIVAAPEYLRGGFAIIHALERIAADNIVGVTLNGKYLAEPVNYLASTDALIILENYEYYVTTLDNEGCTDCEGTINIID